MASWTRPLAVLALILGACEGEPALDCDTSPWTWENTGGPFMYTWCTSCHHADLEEGQRQGAPTSINLDTVEDVWAWQDRIMARSLGPSASMPPAGGPTEAELLQLEEWLLCDAPE